MIDMDALIVKNTIDAIQSASSLIASISISVFTLTTAFLVSKSDSINHIYKSIEEGGHSMTTSHKLKNMRSFIKSMKSITKNSLFAFGFSILSFLLITCANFLQNSYWIIFSAILWFVSCYYIAICIAALIKWYIRFHKQH